MIVGVCKRVCICEYSPTLNEICIIYADSIESVMHSSRIFLRYANIRQYIDLPRTHTHIYGIPTHKIQYSNSRHAYTAAKVAISEQSNIACITAKTIATKIKHRDWVTIIFARFHPFNAASFLFLYNAQPKNSHMCAFECWCLSMCTCMQA